MDKAKPIFKTLILGLTSLVAILGLILIPLMTCTKPAQAAGTDSYLLLEYLESNGGQNIDTGFVPNDNTRVVLDFQFTSTPSQWAALMGSAASNLSSQFWLAQRLDNQLVCQVVVIGTQYQVGKGITLDLNRHRAVGDAVNKLAAVDGTYDSINQSSLGVTTITNSMVIFNYTNARIYSSQIYNNGVLARDFVPVKRVSDGELGLLDRVNDVFYVNIGTGSFSAGYLPNDYYVCSYIHSTGTQYIDTGSTFSQANGLSIYFKSPTKYQTYPKAFGARTGYNDNALVLDINNSNYTPSFAYNNGSYYTISNADYRNDTYIEIYKGIVLANGSSLTTLNLSINSPYTFSIFCMHSSAGYTESSDMYLYNFSMNQNGLPVKYFIPVYNPINNEAGLWDNVTNTWYGNLGTGSFDYQLSGGASVYQVNNENALNSALTSSVAGDVIVFTNNITVSTQTITVGNAPVFWNSFSLSSSYHPNNALYSTEGWYSTQWTTKITNGKMVPSTTYTARFQADVNSATSWGLVLGNALAGDIINITGGFTYTTNSFTIPANVTVNKNSYTVLPPANSPLTQVGYNSDASATTDASSFVANTTYYAIYVIPSYVARLIIDLEVTIDMSGFTATTTEYSSYTSIEFAYTYGTAIQIPVPTWELHSFNGWWLNGTIGPYSGISSTDYGDKVFYARWVEAPQITIGNVNIFRNLINNGDRLIMFTSNIDFENLPNDNVRSLFMFRLMDTDGTTVLASTQPYYAYNGGYYLQAVGFYFPDDSVIEWGEEYQIRIDGNPSRWYTISDVREIYNITGVNYTEASSEGDNELELSSWVFNIAHALENDWVNYISFPQLITTGSNGNEALTKAGLTYFINTVPILDNIFNVSDIIDLFPDDPMPNIPASPSLIERWENQYEGTWVQESLQAFGDLFHTNWRTITSILCLILWVIFAAISQMKWGTTDAGLWMGAVMFGVMVTMGLMNWAVVITAAILMSLYSLYIVFWRQG